MLQRNFLLPRGRALVLTIAAALFGVAPHHVIAQTAQSTMVTPISSPAVPAPATPSPPPSVATTAVPAIPSAPPALPHPVSKGISTHVDSDHAQLLVNGNIFNATGDTEDSRALKSQKQKQQTLGRKQQEPGRQQWIRSERLRVANEAARREADRMVNAASPMDWRNRYSSD